MIVAAPLRGGAAGLFGVFGGVRRACNGARVWGAGRD